MSYGHLPIPCHREYLPDSEESTRRTESTGSGLGAADRTGREQQEDIAKSDVLVHALAKEGIHTYVEIDTRQTTWIVRVDQSEDNGAQKRLHIRLPCKEGKSRFTLRVM